MLKKISVVSTVYNGEEYFDKAIPSILHQSFSDFEWIIVDDGSTDSTLEMLKELSQKDNRVKIFASGRLGRSKALNYAIEKAQGIYIANQDFDDVSYSERLKLQVEFLDANPEVGLIGCNYILRDENRKENYIRICPIEHHNIVQTMAKYIPFAHTLVTFRKEAWVQAGGYSEPNNLVDIRLWIEMAKKGWHFAGIPETLGEHFVHAKSFWHQNFQYSKRQKHLASVQWQAIRELDIPLWMSIYPIGRYIYIKSPNSLKSFLRRAVAGSKEKVL